MSLRSLFHWSTIQINSGFLEKSNNYFIYFFSTFSWFIYAFSCLFMTIGISYYYIKNAQRQRLTQRRRELLQINQRPQQKRRPGAVARTYEISRNIMEHVNEVLSKNPKIVFRVNHTGTIYGEILDKQYNKKKRIENQDK